MKSDSLIMRFVLAALVLVPVLVLWQAISEGVTPYGDYCQWCSAYGICKDNIGQQESVTIIEKYFSSKGTTAVIINHKGRFVEVELYNNNTKKPFDKVLFDRKTGRFRSTY